MDEVSSCCLPGECVGPSTPSAQPNHGAFQGVAAKRSCTDVLFLVIFFLFIFVLGFGLYYAAARGDVDRFIYGYDYDGDVCGRLNSPLENIKHSGKNTLASPFLYRRNGSCVASCPPEAPPLLRQCLEIGLAIHQNARDFLKQVAVDFEICVKDIVYLCLIAIGLSFLMTVFFRYCAGVVIWTLLGAIVIGSLAGTFYLWWLWFNFQTNKNSLASAVLALAVLASLVAATICLVVFVMRKRVELVVALFYEAGKAVHAMPFLLVQPIGTLITVILVCAAWMYAAAWIESSGIPTRDASLEEYLKELFAFPSSSTKYQGPSLIGHTVENPLSVLESLAEQVLNSPHLDNNLFLNALKHSAAIPEYAKSHIFNFIALKQQTRRNADSTTNSSIFDSVLADIFRRSPGSVYFPKDTYLQIVRWQNIFAALWFTQMCLAIQYLIVAGAVAQWFFTRDKSSLQFPIVISTRNAWFYHLGSAACGSFFITLLNLLVYFLKKIERRVRKGTNCCGLLNCLKCVCWLGLYMFRKILQFITTNAYIEIAIYGDGFCTSAGRAVRILANNALRIVVINSVGDFVLRLGKLGVVAATVIVGVELMKGKPGVEHFWAPLLAVSVFAYLIAHCFISVYEMCIDTIFICFCEDCEMNDGVQRPYFMSRGLMEFVERSRKVLRPTANRATVQQQPAIAGQPGRAFDNPAMVVNDEGRIWNAAAPPSNYPYHFQPTAPSYGFR